MWLINTTRANSKHKAADPACEDDGRSHLLRVVINLMIFIFILVAVMTHVNDLPVDLTAAAKSIYVNRNNSSKQNQCGHNGSGSDNLENAAVGVVVAVALVISSRITSMSTGTRRRQDTTYLPRPRL